MILANWALSAGVGPVLDPSFGQGVFLNAAARVLNSKGILNPGRLVFGVDVDPACLEYVHGSGRLLNQNCVAHDFLTLSLKDLGQTPFQAVVGNPPYIRHHWLDETTRHMGRAAARAVGATLPETANAWAYFVVHALSFIAEGGRLAMVVPEAILQADYAAGVRKALGAHFERVRLVYIRDRLFQHTNEAVVVVAASEFGRPGNIWVNAVEGLQDLAGVLNHAEGEDSSTRPITPQARIVDANVLKLLSELEGHPSVRKLSDVATIRIGLVTGANNHFIQNAAKLEAMGVPRKAWQQVVSRTQWLSGLDFTKADLQNLIDLGRRAILVSPTPECEDHPGIRQWIFSGRETGAHQRFKCATRVPWFRVPLPPAPDAFATCTRMGTPRFVVNGAACHCTNALHGVYWHHSVRSPKAAAVGFLTSAVGVWAEIYGRRYGGGVLKMEPGILSRMPVPLFQAAENSFEELNALMRRGREVEAGKLADDLVLRYEMGLPKVDVLRLRRARFHLMSQRRPSRDECNHG